MTINVLHRSKFNFLQTNKACLTKHDFDQDTEEEKKSIKKIADKKENVKKMLVRSIFSFNPFPHNDTL